MRPSSSRPKTNVVLPAAKLPGDVSVMNEPIAGGPEISISLTKVQSLGLAKSILRCWQEAASGVRFAITNSLSSRGTESSSRLRYTQLLWPSGEQEISSPHGNRIAQLDRFRT